MGVVIVEGVYSFAPAVRRYCWGFGAYLPLQNSDIGEQKATMGDEADEEGRGRRLRVQTFPPLLPANEKRHLQTRVESFTHGDRARDQARKPRCAAATR